MISRESTDARALVLAVKIPEFVPGTNFCPLRTRYATNGQRTEIAAKKM